MKRFFLNFSVVVLAIVLGASGVFSVSACNPQSSSELREELAALRSELREMRQMRYDLRTLEKDMQEMRGRLKREDSSSDTRPIVPQRFTPDGSHLDDPFLGPRDAKTIVMAFGDFQCRPCRAFYETTFPALKTEFIDTGKLRFIYRDFTLRSNQHAAAAAALAHCAGEQGEYWQMFELLFRNKDQVDAGNFVELAKSLSGVNNERLIQCAQSTRYEKELQKDIAEGVRIGAKGAPGFFVGKVVADENDTYQGVFIRGAQPFAVIRAQIEKLL